MSASQQFSEVAKNYLCRFHEILNNMVTGMCNAELTDSLSNNFIVQMIPHHEAAVEMSRNLLQYTTLIPLQNIAQNIITEQTKGIEQMRAALSCCSTEINSCQDICLYNKCYEQITQTMFSEMRCAPASNNINLSFIKEMIPHHEGAIRMSENALRFPVCQELVPILNSIIVSQKNGVKEMQHLLHCI